MTRYPTQFLSTGNARRKDYKDHSRHIWTVVLTNYFPLTRFVHRKKITTHLYFLHVTVSTTYSSFVMHTLGHTQVASNPSLHCSDGRPGPRRGRLRGSAWPARLLRPVDGRAPALRDSGHRWPASGYSSALVMS
jgi:hypothetical protein